MKKSILKSKDKDKSNSSKKSKSKNNIKLPKIESTKKKQAKPNEKLVIPNQIPENSLSSILSQSSIRSKSDSNNSLDEKIKPKLSSQKINDIINDVNKNHNINTKVTEKKVDIENKTILKEKDKDNTIISNNNKNIIDNNSNKNISLNNSKNNILNKIKIKKFNYKPNHKFLSPRINLKIFNDSSPKIIIDNKVPRISKEKLKEIKEKRNKRLLLEKKKYEIQMKMLEDLKENNNINKKQEIELSNKIYSPIEINHKKAQNILKKAGMIDAYKFLIEHLCKNGVPSGNLYEYSSNIIKNYEKEWKKKKFKMMNEKIEKHFDKKKKLILSNESGSNRSNDNLFFKIIKRREQGQFLKKLDKSRSTLHIIKKIPEFIKKIENKKEANNNEDKNTNKSNINKSNNNKINTNVNKINNKEKNNENNTIINKESKQLNNNENIINIQNNNKEVKDNTIDKKVYFNIKLINNEEEVKEKNEDDLTSINSNTILENKTKSQRKDNEENSVKKKKGKSVRHSIAISKRDLHKFNEFKDENKNLKNFKVLKSGIIEEENNLGNDINSNENFGGEIKTVKSFSRKFKHSINI